MENIFYFILIFYFKKRNVLYQDFIPVLSAKAYNNQVLALPKPMHSHSVYL